MANIVTHHETNNTALSAVIEVKLETTIIHSHSGVYLHCNNNGPIHEADGRRPERHSETVQARGFIRSYGSSIGKIPG